MKIHLISDNMDTYLGMRMAGIEGVVIHERQEVLDNVYKSFEDKSIGIVLITDKLVELCHDEIYELKLTRKSPLIVEIPDRHGSDNITAALQQYVSEAVGIKL